MKNVTKTIGIVGGFALLFGGIFKMMHWPGASILLVFGMIPVIMFIFMWLGASLKNVTNSKEKIALMVLGLLLFLMALSAVFRIQHWPGAKIMMLTHYILLVVLLIPVFFIYLNSEVDDTKKNGRFGFFIFYLATSGLFLAKGGLSTTVMRAYDKMQIDHSVSIKDLDTKNDLLYNSISDSSNSEQLEKIKALSASFQNYLKSLRLELISKTEEISLEAADTLSNASMTNRENYDMPTHILIGNLDNGTAINGPFTATELKTKIEEYRSAILALANPSKKEVLDSYIGLSTKNSNQLIEGIKSSWELENFYHTPLSADLAILSQIQINAKFAEGEVISSLK